VKSRSRFPETPVTSRRNHRSRWREIRIKAYDSVAEAKASLGTYLRFYNERRPHRSLGGQTPDAAYFANLAAHTRPAA